MSLKVRWELDALAGISFFIWLVVFISIIICYIVTYIREIRYDRANPDQNKKVLKFLLIEQTTSFKIVRRSALQKSAVRELFHVVLGCCVLH